MKKNTMMRIASVLLVAVLATTCVISGTFAKYISTADGTDTARVAKWDFTVEGAKVNTTDFVFDLFNTINDTDGSEETDVLDAADTNAATTQIIAPGTSGSFVIDLVNLSEVNAKYKIDFELTNTNNIPLLFKVGDGEWAASLAAVAETAIAMANDGDTDTDSVTVQWKWEYETDSDPGVDGIEGDAVDTALGNSAISGDVAVSVKATVTVWQVD